LFSQPRENSPLSDRPQTIARPPLRYHGGKFRLAGWITAFFPVHRVYVEPFGGAAGVLLQKPRSAVEVYNDMDQDIVNFFAVLRDPDKCVQLLHALALTPYARDEFEAAYQPTDDPVEQARRTAIRAHMGFGSAGATKGRTGWRMSSAPASPDTTRLWVSYPDVLASVAQRLQGVFIENRPALQVMQQHDHRDTLHFVDPPYLSQTRDRAGTPYYRHEMSDEEHVQLLVALKALRGMVVLCGYPSEMFDTHLTGWTRHTKDSRIAGNRGTKMRQEVVWLNPACQAALQAEPNQLELCM
jgi:DNA adenine methylase